MDPREYDYEGDMAKSQLKSIIINAQQAHDMLEDDTNMAEWVQSKITLAADYISTVADYMQSEVNEAVTVKKANYSWGKMMTVHHGSDTSYPLHPEHQSAIKKLRPGMKTTFKDETNSTVHAHREGDTVHLTRPKTGSTLTSLPYHHFDTSEHAKPTAKKPAGEYDRKVTDHLKKKYNEEVEPIDELSKSTLGNKIPAVSENTFKSFRNQIVEKHLTPAEMKKREEIAKAIHKENPGMPMGNKMAIATASAKKAA